MLWTCCQCGNTYDYDEGDTEERMCFECLYDECDEEYEDYVQNLNKVPHQVGDLMFFILFFLVCWYFFSHLW